NNHSAAPSEGGTAGDLAISLESVTTNNLSDLPLEVGAPGNLSEPLLEVGTPGNLSAAPPESGTLNNLAGPSAAELGASVSVSTSVLENEIKARAESGEPQRPLVGRRVIVTRAVKQSGEMTRALEALGAEVIPCPTIEIREPSNWAQLDRALIHLSWYDWLAFTSVNGVEYFLGRLDALGDGRGEGETERHEADGR